jgi:hypothetical protein
MVRTPRMSWPKSSVKGLAISFFWGTCAEVCTVYFLDAFKLFDGRVQRQERTTLGIIIEPLTI